jgi:hypothetical protein
MGDFNMSPTKADSPLKRADSHHNKAAALYRAVLLSYVKKAGSVANLAARLKIPVTTLHSSLNEKAGYLNRRNMAHEVARKFEDTGGG